MTKNIYDLINEAETEKEKEEHMKVMLQMKEYIKQKMLRIALSKEKENKE